MNNLSVKFKFLYAIVIFLASNVANSCVMVDIEEFPGNKMKIVTCHTQHQALLHYEVSERGTGLNRQYVFQQLFSKAYNFNDNELKYTIEHKQDGSLSIQKPVGLVEAVSKESYMVLCSKAIQSNVGVTGYNAGLKKYYWATVPIVEKTPDQISQIIKGMQNKRPSEAPFVLTIPAVADIKTLASMSDDDKGVLGEMLTRNTLFSFGYNCLPSIYKSNNGLDGIFVSFSNMFMFLTQSKAGNSHPLAPTLVKNELNEPHVHKRLLLMKSAVKPEIVQSFNVVADFLKNRPASIYKLGHSLFYCGFADIYIEKLNIQAFPKEGFAFFNAAPEEKVKAVSTTLKSLAENPMDQLGLALASINLAGSPKKDTMTAVMAKIELSAEQRAAILRIMDAE